MLLSRILVKTGLLAIHTAVFGGRICHETVWESVDAKYLKRTLFQGAKNVKEIRKIRKGIEEKSFQELHIFHHARNHCLLCSKLHLMQYVSINNRLIKELS